MSINFGFGAIYLNFLNFLVAYPMRSDLLNLLREGHVASYIALFKQRQSMPSNQSRFISLLVSLENAQRGSDKGANFAASNDMARFLDNDGSHECIKYYVAAAEAAAALSMNDLVIEANQNLANAYFIRGLFELALPLHKKNLGLVSKQNQKQGESSFKNPDGAALGVRKGLRETLAAMADHLEDIGDYPEAIRCLLECCEHCEVEGSPNDMIFRLGNVYLKSNDVLQAANVIFF